MTTRTPASPPRWPTSDQEWHALLRWLYQSAPLLEPPAACELLDPLLAPHEPDPAMLQAARDRLAQGSDLRLGKLFEAVLGLAIAAQPHLDVLHRNVVINSEQRTLGELDLIIRDRRDRSLIHVEVTLKFYLGLTDGRFPGPNPEDNLARKYQRLATHQFPLLHEPETRTRLRELGLPAVDRQCLFSRGRLFYPPDRPVEAPAQAWAGHERGHWWRARSTPPDEHWYLLARPQWLAAAPMSDSDAVPLASDELIDYVQARQRPQMVVRQGGNGPGIPSFVVPDRGWP